MATITLRLDTTDFQRAVRKLKAKAPVAIARSLNRAAKSAHTAQARAVAQDMGIPVGTAKKAMRIEEATAGALVSRVEARGARLPLIAFRARGPEPSRGRGRGVTARLPGGAGRYPRAFIATLQSGHRGVFERASALTRRSRGAWGKNLPILEKHGPSIPHVFNKHRAVGIAAGEASLTKNLSHEFRWALEQSATGS
jgi:hypothetical protein